MADDNFYSYTAERRTMSNDAQTSTLTDGFHLVIDALKLNGISNIYGRPVSRSRT
jgi:hypothetical protein